MTLSPAAQRGVRCTQLIRYGICAAMDIRSALPHPAQQRAHVDRTGGPWAAGLLWSGLSCVLTSTVSLERKARDAERKKRKRAEQKAARDAAAAMRQVKASSSPLAAAPSTTSRRRSRSSSTPRWRRRRLRARRQASRSPLRARSSEPLACRHSGRRSSAPTILPTTTS